MLCLCLICLLPGLTTSSFDSNIEMNYLLLATTKPPSTKTISKVKVPNAFAMTSVLPTAAMNLKRDRAI